MTKYAHLALHLKFWGGKSSRGQSEVTAEELFAEFNLQLRKGKTMKDVKHAIVKAHKPSIGRGDTNAELGMLEVYLKGVLKPLKEVK